MAATLDPEVTGEFDSGGLLAGAPTASVTGARRVARLLLTSFEGLDVDFVGAHVNGEPADEPSSVIQQGSPAHS